MKRYLLVIMAAVSMVSCIETLELTPDIEGTITAFEVVGQTRSSINAATRTVNVDLEAGVDPSTVTVARIELIETASCDLAPGSVIDLSTPRKVMVTTAADYEWTLYATVAPETGGNRPLPGGDFDRWSSTGSRPTWNPWPRGSETSEKPEDGEWEVTRWWDTGNRGVNMLGPSNSIPTEAGEGCPANPGGTAARLESKYVMVKAAGGNIYFGQFGEFTPTLDATCHLGHNWQDKPTGLKGWYKYFPQPIDAVSDKHVALHPFGLTRQEWLGTMDSLHVCVALWASPGGEDIPFTVDTTPDAFVDFSRDQPGVLAYGAFISGDEQAEWDEFEIEMEYLIDDNEPLPANTQLYLLITASKSCNYFIAGTGWNGTVSSIDDTPGSLMYVDELELVY